MTASQLQWVQESGDKDSNATSLSKVRSQAMKDYRRRQRMKAVAAHRALNARNLGNELPQNKQSSDDVTPKCTDTVRHGHHAEPLSKSQFDKSHEDVTAQERILSYLQGRQARYFLESKISSTTFDPSQFRTKLVENCMATMFPGEDWQSPVVGDVMSGWTNIKDAVALLNIGCSTGDDRSLMEGRKRHLITVQALRRELQNPNAGWEEALATALDLIFCEIYLPVASMTGQDGLTKHLLGVQAILKWRDRETHAEMYGSWLSILYGQLDLMHGLVNRTPLLLGKQPLGSVPWPIAPGSVCALIQIISRLPSLLHTTDRIQASSQDPGTDKAIRNTRHALFSLEDNLFCWLTKFRPSPGVLKACATTSDSDPLIFPSHNEGLTINMYWTAKLLVAEALLHLETLLPSTPMSDQNSEDNFAAEADRYASLLCRSVPSLSRSCGGLISKGLALRAPLYFAGRWYENSGYEEGLKWCREVEGQLREELTWLNWEALLPWSLLPILWVGVRMRGDGTIAVSAKK